MISFTYDCCEILGKECRHISPARIDEVLRCAHAQRCVVRRACQVSAATPTPGASTRTGRSNGPHRALPNPPRHSRHGARCRLELEDTDDFSAEELAELAAAHLHVVNHRPRYEFECSLLQRAVSSGCPEYVDVLLDAGADVDFFIKNPAHGETPGFSNRRLFHYAPLKIALLMLSLKQNASVTFTMLRSLAEHGATINCRRDSLTSPLHLLADTVKEAATHAEVPHDQISGSERAGIESVYPLARYLVYFGADPHAKDANDVEFLDREELSDKRECLEEAIAQRQTDLLAALTFGTQFHKATNIENTNCATPSLSLTSPKHDAIKVNSEDISCVSKHAQSPTKKRKSRADRPTSKSATLCGDVVRVVLEFVLPCASRRSRREKLVYIFQQRQKYLRV